MVNLQSHADRINTGTEDAETSRALVVYNLTDESITGIAVFFVSMSWPIGTPLPPVSVMNGWEQRVPSAITNMATGPDSKGRLDRCQMTFQMRFWAEEIPAQGWKTYVAAYVTEPSDDDPDVLGTPVDGLTVMETLRHDGDLPMQGTF